MEEDQTSRDTSASATNLIRFELNSLYGIAIPRSETLKAVARIRRGHHG